MSISLSRLKAETLSRTVPSGKVPTVLCANGAQCSPARSAIPRFAISSATLSGERPSTVNDKTPACKLASSERNPCTFGILPRPSPARRMSARLWCRMRSGRCARTKAMPASSPRDAGDVVRPCLQTVGKKVRHALAQRFAACAALNERERVAAAEQQPRPLRAVKSLMPRHGKECGRERGKVDRQRAPRIETRR